MELREGDVISKRANPEDHARVMAYEPITDVLRLDLLNDRGEITDTISRKKATIGKGWKFLRHDPVYVGPAEKVSDSDHQPPEGYHPEVEVPPPADLEPDVAVTTEHRDPEDSPSAEPPLDFASDPAEENHDDGDPGDEDDATPPASDPGPAPIADLAWHVQKDVLHFRCPICNGWHPQGKEGTWRQLVVAKQTVCDFHSAHLFVKEEQKTIPGMKAAV